MINGEPSDLFYTYVDDVDNDDVDDVDDNDNID